MMVTGNDSNNINQKDTTINPLIIGIGQGGGNIANAIRSYCSNGDYDTILINMSSNDLNSVTEISDNMKMKVSDYEGSGQDRNLSKSLFKDKIEGDYFSAFLNIYNSLLFKENRVILVCFSTSGGTGSGISPWFLANLTYYCATYNGKIQKQGSDGNVTEVDITDKMRPKVIGVGILPSLKCNFEGIKCLQNTLECMKELNTLIEKRAISLFLVNNDISTYVDTEDIKGIYNEVNINVAKTFYRFFKIFGESNIKSLDLSDRLNALAIPGLMSFLSHNDLILNKLPFIVDENVVYKRLLAELPEENNVENTKYLYKCLNDRSIKYGDTRIGFIKKDEKFPNNKLTDEETQRPISLLAGLDSIAKLTEPYSRKLDVLIEKQKTNIKNLKDNGTGFENIDSTGNAIKSMESKNLDTSILDI